MLVEIEEQHTGDAVETSVQQLTDMGMSAFFFRDGVLKPFEEFDEASNKKAIKTQDYVNNFIFKPNGTSSV